VEAHIWDLPSRQLAESTRRLEQRDGTTRSRVMPNMTSAVKCGYDPPLTQLPWRTWYTAWVDAPEACRGKGLCCRAHLQSCTGTHSNTDSLQTRLCGQASWACQFCWFFL